MPHVLRLEIFEEYELLCFGSGAGHVPGVKLYCIHNSRYTDSQLATPGVVDPQRSPGAQTIAGRCHKVVQVVRTTSKHYILHMPIQSVTYRSIPTIRDIFEALAAYKNTLTGFFAILSYTVLFSLPILI